MKKIISSILIVLTILQVFAPFSVGLNKAEAAGNLNFVATTSKKDSTITVSVAGSIKTEETKTYISGALVTLSDGKTTQQKKLDLYGNYLNLNNQAVFSNIDASSTYKITVKTRLLTTGTKKVVNGRTIVTPLNQNIDLWDMTTEQYNDLIKKSNLEEQQLPITEVAGNAKDGVQSFQRSEPSKNDTQKTPSTLPACGLGILGSEGTPIGCLAQGLYYLLFVPTSFLFGLTGQAMDFTLMYSISDASYRSTFVTEGWGIVRDFCNMFFIFVLLYIAFGTILNLSGVKTKEMIINVVIIGVLLNFSLFATQVIIDASNILTRVFYNQNTIATGAATKDAEGNIVSVENSLGDMGEIKLSQAIVTKVDPQVLIINATKINQIPIRGKTTDEAPTTEGGLTTGSYILVILLSSAINIFGMIVFLSCALIFVSRVVGLWLAMILAPLAFFSYTVPALQGMKMIGWKHWWPETLKLAFLAPVFAFFMYIIVAFMNKGLDVINANSKTGLSFVVAVVVPFVFIMVLLMKAKDMAKDMSGEMGQSITKGLSAVGGLALGAATGGVAMAGRATLGRVANKIGNTGWLNDAAAGKNGKVAQVFGKAGKNLTNLTSKSSFDFRQTKAGSVFSKEVGMDLNKGTGALGLDTKNSIGGWTGVQQRKVEKENKFAETLGFDHGKYEEIGDDIAKQEAEIKKFKADKTRNHNDSDYKAELAELENKLDARKKEQERVKSGRAKEYALTMKRKSGKIYDVERVDNITEEKVQELENKYNRETDPDKKQKAKKEYDQAFKDLADKDNNTYRDSNGNIKKFGHANKDGERAAKQIMIEFAKGLAAGATTGAVIGSVVPVLGTGIGAISGGIIGALKSTIVEYSGTTNRKTGDDTHGDKKESKDNYKPAPSSGGKSSASKSPSGSK